MPPAQLSLANVSTVLQSYEGRDKTARFLQFAARFVVGLTARAKAGTICKYREEARKVLAAMTSARRTFRLGRELPVLLSMTMTNETELADRLLELAQKAALVVYFVVDHVGWLKQVHRGVKSGSKTIQLGLKWLAISSFISVVAGLRNACKDQSHPDASSGDNRKAQAWNIIRDSLVAVQALHLSRWMEIGDATVGVLGMASSIMDVVRVWPEKPPKAALTEVDRMKRPGSSEWRSGQAAQACRLRNTRVAPAA
ncbi:unnamed protein product [Durusdinium trenchii]|uniref:Uncharacterized protein n=2 Tax=Durusdinium trenchii TaxID=1381693 RepID=A0ABP0P2R0_9DINO